MRPSKTPRLVAGRASWWLKLERAEKHFKEFDAVIRDYRATDPYRISKRQEGHGQRARWVHRMEIDQPDEGLAVIAGDFLFNVRSALDHIAVAHAPRRNRRQASFPIYTDDIWERDAGGQYLERFADDRTRWHQLTGGMSPEALAIIKGVQPYNAGPDPNDVGAEAHVLATLSRFQNADKHRELAVVASAIAIHRIDIVHASGIVQPVPHSAEPNVATNDQAEISPPAGIEPATVEMKPYGTVVVLLTRANVGADPKRAGLIGPMFEANRSLTETLRFVREEVVGPLAVLLG